MGKKWQIILIIFIGMAFFSLSFNFAIASDNDDDGIDDNFEEINKRDIEIEIEADKIQIESFLRSGVQKDEIQFNIKNESEGLSVEVSYQSEISSENTTGFELEFGIIFRKLIEFVDLNDNSVYDPLIDDTIQEFNLTDFQPVKYTKTNISADTSLHHFVVNTTNGVFSAHIYFSEEFYMLNGILVTPIQSKMDIEISNFPYLNVSSQLALYTSLDSEINFEEEEDTEDEIRKYATNEKGVISEMNNFIGIFTWKNNATIDGFSREVLVSNLDNDDYEENEQKIYLNYPRGSQIYHDPKIGIAGVYKIEPVIDNTLFLIILIAILSSLSITLGYAFYHYRERIFIGHYSEKEAKMDLERNFHGLDSDSERIKSLFDNKKIKHQLKELSSDKMGAIDDIKLTALSEDFFKTINAFEWEEDDLVDFIREMISLTPEERTSVFNEMISKSEQQKKNRLDDTKGLYT